MENDNELLYYCHSKSEYALENLVRSYERLIWKIIHSFDIKNYESDVDDYYQICVMELVRCIDRYMDCYQASFKTYFYRCAKTALLNMIVKENDKSYHQIKNAIALDSCVCEESERYLSEVIEDKRNNYDIIMQLDLKRKIEILTTKCKENELLVWKLKINGFSYAEIEKITNVKSKKIDNTIRKINKLIKNIY